MRGDGGRTGHSIAVIGTGISGLSAAWLLSQRHEVTVYEADHRPGGHSNTVDAPSGAGAVPVDTGFIVFNEHTYPNLTALFRHLEVPTRESDMSFAVSLDDGDLEYAATDLSGLFAQKVNLIRPRYWRMLRDLVRFYREAPAYAARADAATSIGDYLDRHGFSSAFQDDHLMPMAAAVWSGSAIALRDYPARSFIRFCDNHGLLKITNRPIWRTVEGGSRAYVRRLLEPLQPSLLLGRRVTRVRRRPDGVIVHDSQGAARHFDHVVIAAHADQALALLDDPTPHETTLLSAFRYAPNRAVLHNDPTLMPRRRTVWSSWNYLGRRDAPEQAGVTYWMNRLQGQPSDTPLFVSLNPEREPLPDSVIHTEDYAHPQFDAAAMAAQERLWSLQGQRRTWFCGAYFGAGFHEDGLQAGLAVAEQLGGLRRPWNVTDESGRIHVTPVRLAELEPA